MTDPSPIRVLIVDDQALVRMGFAMVLSAQDDIEVVGEAADGASGVQMIEALRPDVVLMDVRMPGLDGIAATERAIAAHPEARIIILTTFDLDEYAFAALRAGASGFLLKDARPADLLAAIRAVASGDAALAPRVSRRLLELFAGQLPATADDAAGAGGSQLDALTARETEIFALVAEGMTNQEIADRLVVSEATVKTHVGRILAKLGLRDRVQMVILAYESGFLRRA